MNDHGPVDSHDGFHGDGMTTWGVNWTIPASAAGCDPSHATVRFHATVLLPHAADEAMKRPVFRHFPGLKKAAKRATVKAKARGVMAKPWFHKRTGQGGTGYSPLGAMGIVVLVLFCVVMIAVIDGSILLTLRYRWNVLVPVIGDMVIFLALLAGLLRLIWLKSDRRDGRF